MPNTTKITLHLIIPTLNKCWHTCTCYRTMVQDFGLLCQISWFTFSGMNVLAVTKINFGSFAS